MTDEEREDAWLDWELRRRERIARLYEASRHALALARVYAREGHADDARIAAVRIQVRIWRREIRAFRALAWVEEAA